MTIDDYVEQLREEMGQFSFGETYEKIYAAFGLIAGDLADPMMDDGRMASELKKLAVARTKLINEIYQPAL